MTPRLQRLFDVLGRESLLPKERLGEITIEVPAAEYLQVCRKLRDHPDLRFEQLMDLTGVDYASYGDKPREGPRFAVALHLLSITHNWRLRVRAFCPDDQFPLLPSVFEIWPSVNWYEREAFDLFGIVFEGHPGERPRGDALRPGAKARCLPAGNHRSARSHAAHRARRPLRRRPGCLRFATTR
jgi:NADH:ubiquinone oxidoreductase subunit C